MAARYQQRVGPASVSRPDPRSTSDIARPSCAPREQGRIPSMPKADRSPNRNRRRLDRPKRSLPPKPTPPKLFDESGCASVDCLVFRGAKEGALVVHSSIRPMAYTLIFALFVAGLNASLSRGIENDLTEATFWGHELVTVTDKHPAGFGLVHYLWSAIFAYNEFAVLMLGGLNLVLCVWVLWLVLKELDWPVETRVFPIFLALASFNSYLLLIKYNGNSAPAPFWLLAMLLLLRIQKQPALFHWICLGAVCAVAMFMKYQTAMLLLTIAGYMLTARKTRHWFLGVGPYLAFAVLLALLTPHFIELARYDFPGLRYGIENVTTTSFNPVLARIASPAKFAAMQCLLALPGLGVALYWAFRKKATFELTPDARRFLFWFGFVFPLSPCLVGIITGGAIGDIWGVGAAFLIVPFVLSRPQNGMAPVNALKVGQRTILITFPVFAGLISLAQVFQVHANPKKKVAAAVEAQLAALDLAAPAFVISRSHSASALNFYMDAHPRIIRGTGWDSQPWTTQNRAPNDSVLIELAGTATVDGMAALYSVKPTHVFDVNIPAVTEGLSKHKSYTATFLYGPYTP